jgi:hypothetical protein
MEMSMREIFDASTRRFVETGGLLVVAGLAAR